LREALGALARRAVIPIPSLWSAIRPAARRLWAAAGGVWQRVWRFAGAMWARLPSDAWNDARLRLGALWRLCPPRDVDILRLPLVRPYSAWFGQQSDYVQVALLTFSLAMAFLLSVAAGYIGVRLPAARTAKAQEPLPTLASVLYGWLEQRPAPPSTTCGQFVPPALCTEQLAADAEKWQAAFAAYQASLQSRQYYAVWTRDGKDFPAYNSETGFFTFTLALEGKPQADAKTCVPFRVIAQMPPGITAGSWPDQGDQAKKPGTDIRQRLREVIVKPAVFPHPCLRTTEWTAWVHVEPDTARVWAAWAKSKGWRLEMYFRLARTESLLLPNWDADARLTDGDFLNEQRVWLWVDAVRLAIGDVVVHEWR